MINLRDGDFDRRNEMLLCMTGASGETASDPVSQNADSAVSSTNKGICIVLFFVLASKLSFLSYFFV